MEFRIERKLKEDDLKLGVGQIQWTKDSVKEKLRQLVADIERLQSHSNRLQNNVTKE